MPGPCEPTQVFPAFQKQPLPSVCDGGLGKIGSSYLGSCPRSFGSLELCPHPDAHRAFDSTPADHSGVVCPNLR